MATRTVLSFLLLSSPAFATNNVTFVHGDPARFTYIDMPTPLSGPCDVSEGPDNNVYVQELLADQIVRYNRHTGEIKEFPIPFTTPLLPNVTLTLDLPSIAKSEFLSCAIRNGYDGLMYFSNGNRNQLVQFNTTSEEVRVFTPPGLLQALGNLQPLNDVTTAPDGVYTSMTTANVIAKFTYDTHEWTYFEVPTLLSVPLGMYYASDGGIWFLEFAGNKIGRLDRSTGDISEFPLPLEAFGPVVVRAETQDAAGDFLLWFASALGGGGVGSINERTHEITFYAENLLSFAVEDAQDYDGNIWISHAGQNTLGVLNPRSGNITEVVMPGTILPTSISVPVFGGSGIFCKPVGDPFTKGIGNAVWFTQLFLNRLVRFDLDGLIF